MFPVGGPHLVGYKMYPVDSYLYSFRDSLGVHPYFGHTVYVFLTTDRLEDSQASIENHQKSSVCISS